MSDFFLASSEELDLLDLVRGPHGKFQTIQAKGFDPVSLVSLEAHMTGTPEAAVSQTIAREQSDVTVVALGQAFRDALAAMDGEAVEQFGEEWLLSDDEETILSQVTELARHGKQMRKSLYVWISL